jgi:hypothetical protein
MIYPARRSGLVSRVVDGELVVLDRSRQMIHQLNETASYIWDRCDGRHSVTDIAHGLGRSYNVDRPTAEKDVASAVRQLEIVGLVTTAPRPNSTHHQGEVHDTEKKRA